MDICNWTFPFCDVISKGTFMKNLDRSCKMRAGSERRNENAEMLTILLKTRPPKRRGTIGHWGEIEFFMQGP